MQESHDGLVIERRGGVMTLTIDRPDDQNRLSPGVVDAMLSVAAGLRDDPGIHVLVITGAGTEVFSFGLLNPAIRASLSKDDVMRVVRRGNMLFDALEALPQIVVAAINGQVLAGAAELCLACDLRYAASHATLQMPEATWGGFPGAGAPVRLPMIVGRARALELICTGRQVDAVDMERWGLVQGVFDASTFRASVDAVADRIASSGPLAVRGAKRVVAARQEPGFRAARELSDALRHALEWSQDVDEGMAAHKEGRKPVYVGR